MKSLRTDFIVNSGESALEESIEDFGICYKEIERIRISYV